MQGSGCLGTYFETYYNKITYIVGVAAGVIDNLIATGIYSSKIVKAV